MSQNQASAVGAPLWKRVLFSNVLVNKSAAKKIAYIGVVTALCIATNFFELKFATVQFSLTIFSSVLAGMLIGPVFGFCAVFLGDAIGYFANSAGYLYYWWVALSVATMALVSGLIMNGVKLKCKGAAYIKLAVVCVVTLVLCSGVINSLGMYYLGYIPKSVRDAFETYFGGERTFWAYLVIRFFILGQIYNSIVNYALLFVALPVLRAIKPLQINVT